LELLWFIANCGAGASIQHVPAGVPPPGRPSLPVADSQSYLTDIIVILCMSPETPGSEYFYGIQHKNLVAYAAF